MGIFHDNQVSQYENVTTLDLNAARMMEVVVTTGAIRRASPHSICHHQQTNTLLFTGQRLWSRDHGLETQVHFVQVSVSRPEVQGLGLGLETWRPRSRSRSRDLKSKVSVLVSRLEDSGFGLGVETWRPRSRSWSQDLKRSCQQHCIPVTQPTASDHWRDNACSNMCTILNMLILL